MKDIVRIATFVAVILSAGAAPGADPALVCQSGKLKVTGKYSACRLGAEAKAAKAGEAPDFTRCGTTFDEKFAATETKAGDGVCPSAGDAEDIKGMIDDVSGDVDSLLSGVRFDASGATIVDYLTGLEWEKKNGSGGGPDYANPHDVDNTYTWCAGVSSSCTNPSNPLDGTAATDFLAKLNGSSTGICYEDHCDWRVPTLAEFSTFLIGGCASPPCLADSGFLPDASSFYWSIETYPFGPVTAYAPNSYDPWSDGSGGIYPYGKTTAFFVRAVRGGL